MLRRRTTNRQAAIAILVMLIISLGGATACQNLAFYEKAAFANPSMTAEADIDELHMRQQVHDSRKAAIGGCGCD
ncbi:MAG: hypothetical protein QF570_00680 [Myxococcota bacterium]|nr:hypothetical protein [Myxococcota bacterium]